MLMVRDVDVLAHNMVAVQMVRLKLMVLNLKVVVNFLDRNVPRQKLKRRIVIMPISQSNGGMIWIMGAVAGSGYLIVQVKKTTMAIDLIVNLNVKHIVPDLWDLVDATCPRCLDHVKVLSQCGTLIGNGISAWNFPMVVVLVT